MQVSSMRHADDWSWVTARRQRKKRKVLAGFARATGDGALTATIYDLVVLPELQGLGLGRKLLAKATTQASFLVHCVNFGCRNPCEYWDYTCNAQSTQLFQQSELRW